MFKNTIRMANSLEPDQGRHFVGPDLGLNCLQRLKSPLARKKLNKTAAELNSTNFGALKIWFIIFEWAGHTFCKVFR